MWIIPHTVFLRNGVSLPLRSAWLGPLVITGVGGISGRLNMSEHNVTEITIFRIRLFGAKNLEVTPLRTQAKRPYLDMANLRFVAYLLIVSCEISDVLI